MFLENIENPEYICFNSFEGCLDVEAEEFLLYLQFAPRRIANGRSLIK